MFGYIEKTEKLFRSLAVKVIRFRKVVLLVTLVAVTFLSSFIPNLNIATTLESSYKEHNKAVRDYQEFRDQFGRDDKIVLLIKSEDIFSVHFLARMKQFHEDLENTLPLLSEINSLINAAYIEGNDGRLQVDNFFARLPRTESEAQKYKEKALSYPLFKNRYLSKNADFMILNIKTQAVSALTDDGLRIKNHGRGIPERKGHKASDREGRRSISQVENSAIMGIIDAVVKQYDAENFQITFSGVPAYQFYVEPMIRNNMVKMSLLVLALTFFFMSLLFKRISGIFIPQFVVVMGLAPTLGLMALASVPFTLTSSMLPSILLSVGLTAPIHFMVVFFKYQKEVGRQRAIVQTLGHSGLPIVMTSLTTITGLLCFSFTEIAPVAQLGVFAAIGITLCLVLTLISLPAFLSMLEVLPGGEREQMYEESIYNRLLTGLGRLGLTHAHDIYILSLIAFIIVLPGFANFNFSHNMLHYFTEEAPFIKKTQLIEDETSGFRALEILVDTGRENGIFDHRFINSLEALEDFALDQNSLSGRPFTGKVLSISDIIKETNQAWHGNDRRHQVIPQDDYTIEQQIVELKQARPGFLDKYTDEDFSLARITMMMYWNDAAMDVAFVKQLEATAAGLFRDNAKVIVTGVVSVGSKVIDSMMTSLATGYILVFIIIMSFMIVSVGDFKLGLIAMVPNLFPIVAGLGLMGYLEIPLNTYNLIGGSIIVGVAVDDTIHFFHNFQKYYRQSGDVATAVNDTLLSAGRALITTSLILISCFWIRLFSPLKVISDFGLVMGFSLLVAFLADVVLAPALLSSIYGGKSSEDPMVSAPAESSKQSQIT